MAIEASTRYGEFTVPLTAEALRDLKEQACAFLADPQVKIALKSMRFLFSPGFLQAPYRPVPPHLHRTSLVKDPSKAPCFAEGSYGHWIFLLELLLRMTGKEIVYNTRAWETLSDFILDVSPDHEKIRFLKECLLSDGRTPSRVHYWSGEAASKAIEACRGRFRVRVLPVILCSMKDGWGVRKCRRREVHECLAGLELSFDTAAGIPVSKIQRGYAHTASLRELVELNAKEGSQSESIDMTRKKIEGLDWSLRRLALFARRKAQEVLSSSGNAAQITVVANATDAVVRSGTVVFKLGGTPPVRLGSLSPDEIRFDAREPLPVRDPVDPLELQDLLLRGREGSRPIDMAVATAFSRHDADAHRYWLTRQSSEHRGRHWQKTGERPVLGKWF